MTSHMRTSNETLLQVGDDWAVKYVKQTDTGIELIAQLIWKPQACCDGRLPGFHQWRDHTYLLRPILEQPVVALLMYPLHRCSICRRTQAPTIPPGYYHPSLRQYIGTLGLTMSAQDLAHRYGISLSDVSQMIREVAEQRMAERVVPPPRLLGLDGSSLAGDVRTVVVDLERRHHIDILPNQRANDLITALTPYSEGWQDSLAAIVIDQDRVLRQVANTVFPGVPVVLDRFHVAQQINQGFTAFARRHRASYIERHGNKGRIPPHAETMWSTKPADVAARVSQLQADGWHTLAWCLEYVRQWQGMYEMPTAAAARAAWIDWVQHMPPELHQDLRAPMQAITRHWLSELCAPVDIRNQLGVLPTNAVTEALNKRLRRIDLLTNTTFEMARMRALLAESRESREQAGKDMRAALRVTRQGLKALAKDF